MKRRGFTLVEMLAVISTATVLLTLATQVVHRTMRLHSQSQQRAALHRVALRLSGDFRRDAHLTTQATLAAQPNDGPALTLTKPTGDEVVYTVMEGRVLRRGQCGDRLHQEIYSFPDNCKIDFSQADPSHVSLRVETDPELQGVAPKTVVYVAAEVGRLLRLATIEEPTEEPAP